MRRSNAGRWKAAMSVLAAALAIQACGSGRTSPGGPSAPATPSPTPLGSATPDPPLSASCARLPAGATKYTCDDESPAFRGDVMDAIDALKGQHPEIFDPNDDNVVRNVGAYYVGLIKALDRKGICAGFDGEEVRALASPA